MTAFLRDPQVAGRFTTTLRSYGMDLLRRFRPLGGSGVVGPGNQHRGASLLPLDPDDRQAAAAAGPRHCVRASADRARLTESGHRKSTTSANYKAIAIRHRETVIRSFFDLHLELKIVIVDPVASPARSTTSVPRDGHRRIAADHVSRRVEGITCSSR
ncbi:hypothetical protein ACIBEJ_33540 [Nonomuraea sp. NPDC050790]|uniref:hypothetical protein n=1 Tax=Nonomuraea sp. NPDC050790 TaxID=3364371 RepID=UPI0037A82430